MSERFIKFIPSEEAFWLMHNKPNAFRLLSHIANTARRINGNPDGLLIGQCHLQHWTKYDLSEREYRTAKEILVNRKHILILETNRTRQKSTTGTTTGSTLVQLFDSRIWDINPETIDDRKDDRPTTDRRQTRKNKKEKEDITTKSPPSKIDDGCDGISFNFEIGSFENISADDISSWKLAYPDVEIQQQIRQMQEWIMADPANNRRKVWKRFIVGWLSRNQEKMAIAIKNNPQQKSRAFLGGKELTEYNNAW